MHATVIRAGSDLDGSRHHRGHAQLIDLVASDHGDPVFLGTPCVVLRVREVTDPDLHYA
jgi:hypothetical protein